MVTITNKEEPSSDPIRNRIGTMVRLVEGSCHEADRDEEGDQTARSYPTLVRVDDPVCVEEKPFDLRDSPIVDR